ncbi:MAG: type II toxin-antitoxin system MqsA family antitoxin [Candidatus Ranarchaeia archaeon]
MKCPNCGESMKKQSRRYIVSRDTFVLVLDKVSAYVCEKCGEVYYTEDTVKKIQNLVLTIESSSKELIVVA